MVHNLSFWETYTYFNNIDVAIIGSGIVGLSAALNLKQQAPALKIIILERGFLPTGASTKNAGFACFGSPSELLDDLSKTNEAIVFNLVEKRWLGLQRLRKNLGDETIEFQQWGGYEVFEQDEDFDICAAQLAYLNKKLAPIIKDTAVYKIVDNKIQAFGFQRVKHLILNHAEGQIHTGKMMAALIKKVQELGVVIINCVELKHFSPEENEIALHTNLGFAFATKKLLIAVNGFARELLPDYPVFPARSQVIVTTPIKNLPWQGTFHFDQGYSYFRNIGDRVLLGGGRNLDFNGEATSDFGLTPLIQSNLENHLKNMILPNMDYQIEARWSGIMGLGYPDKSFIVKKVQENIFCAVRMGGMGIAVGSLVGEEAADLVLQ